MSTPILYREIREQPEVLTALLRRESAAVAHVAAAVRARDLPLAMLVARGTSDNAAVYGKYLLESLAHMPVALAARSSSASPNPDSRPTWWPCCARRACRAASPWRW